MEESSQQQDAIDEAINDKCARSIQSNTIQSTTSLKTAVKLDPSFPDFRSRTGVAKWLLQMF